jgi:hypothetical protein
MNPRFQSEIHPDADSLNAFVERLLPEAERARLVAHMADCARCREVVYLAQAAAGEEAVQPVGVRAHPGHGWFAGFDKWRIAWIPAIALTAVGGIAIWLQLKPAPPPVNVAQKNQATAPTAAQAAPRDFSSAAPAPSQSEKQQTERRSSKSPVPDTQQEARNTIPPKARSRAEQKPLSSISSADANAMGAAPPQEAISAPPVPFQPGLAQSALASTQWREQQPAPGSQIATGGAMAAKSAPAPPNMLAVHGSLVAPAAVGPRPAGAEGASPEQLELAAKPPNGLTAMRLFTHQKLPSGLDTVSSAVMLGRILAVDSAGAVFLSRDAGKHWEPVSTQWTGKAVEVHVPQRVLYGFNKAVGANVAVSTAPAPPENSPDEKPAQPASSDQRAAADSTAAAPPVPGPAPFSARSQAGPLMLFTLVNDQHQTWVSTDGKVWRRQ